MKPGIGIVKKHEALLRAHIYSSTVSINGFNVVVDQRIFIPPDIPENLKRVTIITVKAIISPHPHKPIFILRYTGYRIIR
jgi:hypothetical protein